MWLMQVIMILLWYFDNLSVNFLHIFYFLLAATLHNRAVFPLVFTCTLTRSNTTISCVAREYSRLAASACLHSFAWWQLSTRRVIASSLSIVSIDSQTSHWFSAVVHAQGRSRQRQHFSHVLLGILTTIAQLRWLPSNWQRNFGSATCVCRFPALARCSCVLARLLVQVKPQPGASFFPMPCNSFRRRQGRSQRRVLPHVWP